MQTLTIERTNHTLVFSAVDQYCEVYSLQDSNISLTVYSDGTTALKDETGTLWTGASVDAAVDWLVMDCDCPACSGQLAIVLATDYAIIDCYTLISHDAICLSLESGSSFAHRVYLYQIETIVIDREHCEISLYFNANVHRSGTVARHTLTFTPEQYSIALTELCKHITITDITNNAV